jgi:hypothetical protein
MAHEGHQIMWVLKGRIYLAQVRDGVFYNFRKKKNQENNCWFYPTLFSMTSSNKPSTSAALKGPSHHSKVKKSSSGISIG